MNTQPITTSYLNTFYCHVSLENTYTMIYMVYNVIFLQISLYLSV